VLGGDKLSRLPEKTSKKKPPKLDGEELDELAQQIARRISNLVPQPQREQVVAQMVSLVSAERFSGPIAHPRHLREYEEICPGAADRIISMAEKNLEHAQILQTQAMASDIADVKAGRAYGFWALMAIIIAASWSAFNGQEGIALAFLGAGALGVIGQLIQGRRRQPIEEPEG
jgi:uncharacterized membrane protein